jgi:hypothetical protein
MLESCSTALLLIHKGLKRSKQFHAEVFKTEIKVTETISSLRPIEGAFKVRAVYLLQPS